MRLRTPPTAVGGLVVAALLFVAAAPAVRAQPALETGDPRCRDSGLFSTALITEVCWDCAFPLRLAGMTLFGNAGDMPSTAADQAICICPDLAGLPRPGWTMQMWMPANVVELVRMPGCSPSLGGVVLPNTSTWTFGHRGESPLSGEDTVFFHYHVFAFPLFHILELLADPTCTIGGYVDVDLMFMSEFDPTWNNDVLAFFVNPEAAAVANPVAAAACVADAVAANVGAPIDDLFWCLGSWGYMYPLSGHFPAWGSLAEHTSALAARSFAAQYRRGLMQRTVGADVLCRPALDPMFQKSHLQMSMFHPIPEANARHPIGRSEVMWGQWRMIPGIGEDASYVVWRWRDCCLQAF